MPEKLPPIEMDAEINLSDLEGDTKKLRKVLEDLDPSLKKTEKGMDRVEKQAKKTGDSLDKAGKEGGVFNDTLGKLTVGLTAADLAADAIRRTLRGVKDAFVGSVRSAIDFEQQLVNIRKVTGASGEEMKRLKGFIKDLSVETGIAKENLSDIAAGGGRLGIFSRDGVQGLQSFTRTIALAEVAMEDFAGSSEEATSKTAVLLNLFNLESREAEVLLSIMNELSNTAAATSGAIGENVTSFASLQETFGASKESLLALATTMEEVGSEPQAFSTALQTALIEMQKDTKKFADFLGPEMGGKFTEVFAEEPVEAFAIFLQGLQATGRDAGSVLENLGIGNQRLIRELSKLATNKGLDRFAANLETAKEASQEAQDAISGVAGASSSLQVEFDRAADTTGRRMASLGESATNLGEAFGSGLLPAINEVVDRLTDGFNAAIPIVSAVGSAVGYLTSQMIELRENMPKGILGASISFLNRYNDIKSRHKALTARISDLMPRQGPQTQAEFLSQLPSGDTTSDYTPDPPPGGGSKETDNVDKAEKELFKAFDELAKSNKEQLKLERERLMLRKELGVLTRDEERQLGRINNRIEFSEDKIKAATEEWQDQVKALDAVERKIASINEKIEQERQSLQDTLSDIDQDRDSKREETIASLIDERDALDDRLRRLQGLDQEQQERLAELENILNRARNDTPDLFTSGQQIADADELELIDIETEKKKRVAEEESDARLRPLEEELSMEESNRAAILVMVEEKKQAVITALEDRRVTTFATYELLEARLTTHVNHQIAEFNRLKGAVIALTAAQTFGIGSFESQAQSDITIAAQNAVHAGGRRFAEGGPVFGPGGPKDDLIHAKLSNDEHVFTAEDVRAMGGHAAVLEFRNALHSRTLPRFANGGPVSNSYDQSKKTNATFIFNGEAATVAAHPHMVRHHLRKV